MIIDRRTTISFVAFPARPLDSALRICRILAASVLGLVICNLGGGCSDHDLPPGITKKAVAFSEVPTKLTDVAKKEIPGVDFNEAWQNLDPQGKLHSYEIRGRQPSSGKIREVRVSLEGTILEAE